MIIEVISVHYVEKENIFYAQESVVTLLWISLQRKFFVIGNQVNRVEYFLVW